MSGAAPATITLLTDFGLQDVYVGVMRGVIRGIAPTAEVIDLCHEVAPQAVAQAGFMLEAAHRFFPPGAVHVAVVDPGVGSARRILCARTARATYLAPDNGLLSRVLEREPPTTCVSVERAEFFLPDVSRTFHGRDIFAPVGAHLANGLDPRDLGPEVTDWERLPSARLTAGPGERVEARVIHIDHFGNLVTNLEGPCAVASLTHGSQTIEGPLCASYVERPRGQPLLILGSSGYVEVSVNGGSAAALLGARLDDPVQVETRAPE